MEQTAEFAQQNARLDQIEKALDSLHHVSKTVGDELEEQITLIQKLEDETERAHENTRKLHRNLRVTTLNEERTTNCFLIVILFFVFLFIALLLFLLLRK
ncbi:hypothetical protein WA538_003701 [Blastocystis sp. DL]